MTVASHYQIFSLSLSLSLSLSVFLHLCTQDQEFSVGDKEICNKNCEITQGQIKVRRNGKYK
jgi:hypothetical protein